jgi:hypothetical protein
MVLDELTRREVVKSIAVAGAFSDLSVEPKLQAGVQRSDKERKPGRQRVIACGMTEAEADSWEALAEAAGNFFRLPRLHPTDADEVAQAVHIIEYKLLSRPTYCKHPELARNQKK